MRWIPGDASPDPRPKPMIDFTYRYNPARPKPLFVPKDPHEAELYLRVGNELIVRFNEACKRHGFPRGEGPSVVELSAVEAEGLTRGDDGLPVQMPFAVLLGCSDARVPAELLFGQEFNDIFNIRVAGNILAEEGVGSLLYALRAFAPPDNAPTPRSLKLAVVLGHLGCGAVRATIRAFLDPLNDAGLFGEPIGAIMRRITSPPLILAAEAINTVFGPGAASDPARFLLLNELTVYLNAAWVAHNVQELVNREEGGLRERVGVVYTVVDPLDLRVRSLPPVPDEPDPETFGPPAPDQNALRGLALAIARRLATRSGPASTA